MRIPLLPLLLAIAGSASGIAAEAAGSPATPAATSAASSAADLRAARRLVKDAEEQIQLGEPDAAIAIYERVLERYDRTPAGFTARLGLGRLEFAKGAFEVAADHYQRAAARGVGANAEPNPDVAERTEALFQTGLCFVRLGHPERSFPSFRAVIETAPGSDWANRAYYEIGEAHFGAGNHTQAIANFRMVGTSLGKEQLNSLVAELGRPTVITVTDRDLLLLDGAPFDATASTSAGDRETVRLRPIVPGSDTYSVQLPTALGAPAPGDGVIQGDGGTTVTVSYIDRFTTDGGTDKPQVRELKLVGEGRAAITDGAFRDPVREVILDEGRGEINLRVRDPDRDLGPDAERVSVDLVAERPLPRAEDEAPDAPPKYEERGRVTVELVESTPARAELVASTPAATPTTEPAVTAPAAKPGIRSGVFTVRVPLGRAGGELPKGTLGVDLGDRIVLRYRDERHLAGEAPRLREANVTVVPGNTATLMVAGTSLRDANLKVRKELLQAETSLRIGEVYRDMGLENHSQRRFDEALDECRRVSAQADAVDRELREHTLYTLWRIFLAKGALNEAAETCRVLQREFPQSDLIDDSLLALAEAAEQAGRVDQAASLYQQVATLPGGSTLAPEALFRIGKMHESRIQTSDNGKVREDPAARQRAITSYRAVFNGFPDSAFAADAVRRIGDLYFAERDYGQAIDFFERVLRQYPDAPFIDDVLFNLARSRYLKDDFAGALAAVARLEREHPGYQRLDKARTLRQLAQRRQTPTPAGTTP